MHCQTCGRRCLQIVLWFTSTLSLSHNTHCHAQRTESQRERERERERDHCHIRNPPNSLAAQDLQMICDHCHTLNRSHSQVIASAVVCTGMHIRGNVGAYRSRTTYVGAERPTGLKYSPMSDHTRCGGPRTLSFRILRQSYLRVPSTIASRL